MLKTKFPLIDSLINTLGAIVSSYGLSY